MVELLKLVVTIHLAPVSKKRKTPKKSKKKEDKKKFSYDKSIENHGKPFCLGNTIRPSSKPDRQEVVVILCSIKA